MGDDAQTYDASKFERPSVTVDIVMFTVRHDDVQVLLVKRKVWPFQGRWALPGGFMRMDESLDAAAKRELEEEAGVKDVYLEQLYSFGAPKRDPRTRVITVAYFALVPEEKVVLQAGSDADEVRWFSVWELPKLAFDHEEIVGYAVQRMRWKLEYTTVGFSLLPKKFTLTQLQGLYETILHKPLDKRNFRKKIHALGLLRETGEVTRDRPHRPAQLYECKKKLGEIIEIL